MGRCGCAGTCTCAFMPGRGITLSGDGSEFKPITVTRTGGRPAIIGHISNTIETQVTGAGTLANPYLVSMTKRPDAPMTPIMVLFTAPGVYEWEKPAFGTFARVGLLGGGGGGGSGGGHPNSLDYDNTALQFGQGGKPATDTAIELLLAELPASASITVGNGGTGGPHHATSATNPTLTTPGYAGTPGGPSTFHMYTSPGGAAGQSIPQGATFDPRGSVLAGAGGSGGVSLAGHTADANWFGGQTGGPGAEGVIRGGIGGWLGVSGPTGQDGEAPASVFGNRGTGGGGGGSIYGSGGTGGKGGPGAGGGGGGLGAYFGGSGGNGGDGAVRILIQ